MSATTAKQPWEEDWERTLEAAKKEGKVVVTLNDESTRQGIEAFSKYYPEIVTEAALLPSVQAAVRIPEEQRAGLYNYDVYLSGVTSAVFSLFPVRAVGDLRSLLVLPEVLEPRHWVGDGLDDHWIDDVPSEKYDSGFPPKRVMPHMSANAGGTEIYVNRQLLPEARFNKLEDLFNPEMKGKWCLEDPRAAGRGAPWLTEVVMTKGPDFARRLLTDAGPVVSRDRRMMAEDVVRGNLLACVGGDFTLMYEQGLGSHTPPVYLNLGLPLSGEFADKLQVICCGSGKQKTEIDSFFAGTIGGPAVLKNPPHPNAAKVFINWLLTREGQMEYFAPSDHRTCSARADMQDVCKGPAKLEAGKSYISFHRVTNIEFREAGANLAREVLGR